MSYAITGTAPTPIAEQEHSMTIGNELRLQVGYLNQWPTPAPTGLAPDEVLDLPTGNASIVQPGVDLVRWSCNEKVDTLFRLPRQHVPHAALRSLRG